MALDKITRGIIADDAIDATKIEANAVGTSEIADGTVVAADIGDAISKIENTHASIFINFIFPPFKFLILNY